jgi:protein TonB
VRTEILPRAALIGQIFTPSAPAGRKPQPDGERRPMRRAPRPFKPTVMQEPAEIPEKVAMIVDEAPVLERTGSDDGVVGGVEDPSGPLHPTIRNLLDRTKVAPPPEPAKVDTAPAKPIVRVKVGGVVQPPTPIYTPKPVYPHLARMTRVGGTVRLEAVIAIDGSVKNIRLVFGHPLLVNAAVEAVKQWRYTPTLLNNDPVEVVMQVDVNFTLQ